MLCTCVLTFWRTSYLHCQKFLISRLLPLWSNCHFLCSIVVWSWQWSRIFEATFHHCKGSSWKSAWKAWCVSSAYCGWFVHFDITWLQRAWCCSFLPGSSNYAVCSWWLFCVPYSHRTHWYTCGVQTKQFVLLHWSSKWYAYNSPASENWVLPRPQWRSEYTW